jgi:hypothetical protein
MQELKYYTPDISELHVGYEYYLVDEGFHISESQRINNLQDMWTIHHIGVNKIKVLFLTKEQIEKDLEMSNISFTFNTNTKKLILVKDSEIVYKGICKSKNELKKLLEYIR